MVNQVSHSQRWRTRSSGNRFAGSFSTSWPACDRTNPNRSPKCFSLQPGLLCNVRPHHHRRRPGRIRLRHPRGPTRHESGRGRDAQDAGRDLPQHRLHSVEGAPLRLRDVRGGGSRDGAARRRRRGAEARPRLHDEAQGRHRRRQRQRRRLSVQEEQDRLGDRRGPHRCARQGRRQGRGRQRKDAGGEGDRHRDRLGSRAAAWSSRSTRRPSSPRPAR